MTNKTKSYVHDGKEVILTGRQAVKQLKSRRAGKSKEKILFEIQPLSAKDKPTLMFNKWVAPTELFHIIKDFDEEE